MILIREDQYGHIDLAGHPTLRSFPLRKVRGGLLLSDCKSLRSLSPALVVGGTLDLDRCRSLTEIPTTLRVKGSLWIRHTDISELPEGLEVGLNLWLQSSKIKHVPESAKVGGQVYDLGSHVFGLEYP